MGNCIAGSNPALSAKIPERQRIALFFYAVPGTKLASVSGKGIKNTDRRRWAGFQVF
jgi:hypothetical protein